MGDRPTARAVSTWSASMTSATEARVMKTYWPSSPSASVMVGRIRCVATSWTCAQPPRRPAVALAPPAAVSLDPARQPRQRPREEADEEHAEPEVGHRVQGERDLADPRVLRFA